MKISEFVQTVRVADVVNLLYKYQIEYLPFSVTFSYLGKPVEQAYKIFSNSPVQFFAQVKEDLFRNGLSPGAVVDKLVVVKKVFSILKSICPGVGHPVVQRNINDTTILMGQPDVYDKATNQHSEFKLSSRTNRNVTVAKLYSWILKEPVVLLCISDNLTYTVDKIVCDSFDFPVIPEWIGEMREIVDGTVKPRQKLLTPEPAVEKKNMWKSRKVR